MQSPLTASLDGAIARSPTRSNPARFLHLTFAVLLFVLTFLGFQFFYLQGKAYPGREILPQVKTLVMLHGLFMSAWMVLYVVQPLLIAIGNRRLHMAIGKFGAVLAAGMVVLGPMVSVAATRYGPEFPLWGLNRRQFMAIPILGMLVFSVFVGIGVWQRRRPAIHRSMMLLATLAILVAATDRIGALHGLYGESIWGRVFGPFFPELVICAAFLGVKGLLTRSFDRWFAVGFAAFAVVSASIMQIATTDGWFRFASFLVE